MELSSPRFKSLAVTAGLTFWFVILSTAFGSFSFEYLIIFVSVVLAITQIFSYKVSKALDLFAIFNTKIFLGILFKILRIDLLRSKKQSTSYWLNIDEIKQSTIFKEY